MSKPSYPGGCNCGAPMQPVPLHKYRKRHENNRAIYGPTCEKAKASSNLRRRAPIDSSEIFYPETNRSVSYGPATHPCIFPLYTSEAHLVQPYPYSLTPPPVQPCMGCYRSDPEQVLVDGRCSECRNTIAQRS